MVARIKARGDESIGPDRARRLEHAKFNGRSATTNRRRLTY